MSVSSFIFIPAVIFGFILILILLTTKRGNKVKNTILALIMLAPIQSLWPYIQSDLMIAPLFPFNFPLKVGLTFFFGPMLLSYCFCLSTEKPFIGMRLWKHFLLAPLITFGLSIIWIFWPEVLSQSLIVLSFLVYLHIWIYIYFCFDEVKKYHLKAQENFSTLDHINLKWLRQLLGLFAILLVIDAVGVVDRMTDQNWVLFSVFYDYKIMPMSEGLAILMIGFFALRQPEIIFSEFEKDSQKYEHSGLSGDAAKSLFSTLDRTMRKEEVFLENELKLVELAKKLKVSPHHLSQVINEVGGKNFYDYINSFRIEKASEYLREDKGLSISTIAFESGFNNKTSFNNSFRRYKKMTPSEYRQKIIN